MKDLKKIIAYLQYIIISLVICFAIVLRGSIIFGIEPFNVMSNSMKPYFQQGDLVYVDRKCDSSELEKRDVIAFETEGSTVTHRIVNIKSTGFTTKGDANEVEDLNEVKRENVIGKVVFVIPQLGNVQMFFSKYIVEILCAMFILILTNEFINREDKGEKNHEKRIS